MHTLGKFMRNRLPGIGLVSAVALAVAVAATPAAFAQKGKNGKPAESKEFVAAYNAAVAAMNAKDWAIELANAQKAAPLAKDPAARTAALQMQLQANANLGKKDDLLAVIEALLAQPAGLPPDQVKAYRGGQIDIDFAAQYLQLRHAAKHPEILRRDTAASLAAARAAGLISANVATDLIETSLFWGRLQQMIRLLVGDRIEEAKLPLPTQQHLAQSAGCRDFAALRGEIERHAARALAHVTSLLSAPAP